MLTGDLNVIDARKRSVSMVQKDRKKDQKEVQSCQSIF
jgi:hypothetical protein